MSLLYCSNDLEENKFDENVCASNENLGLILKTKKCFSEQITDTMTEDDFLKSNISDLQNFLLKRLINQTGNKATLAKNAYYANCLNVQAQVQSAQDEENEFKNDKLNKRKTSSKLTVDSKSLTYGWVIGPSLFPDVTYAEVQLYLNKRNARKAFRGGKSLFKSEHLSNIRYHNINSDSKYCYIAAYCLPEQKSNNPVYNVWVLIKKKSVTIKSADCDCAAGTSGCCKHVGAPLWYVEHSVKIGDNKTCTLKPLE
ncbi:uncharacterized protein LOC136076069 [Hydra vulgaris]|uniref:Uncharacterized protein LOC136076069 n=1 Tax=Hydra vulgaris TaxID=6087 RepID=A0ABM4B9Q1_HYDVU